MTLAELLSTLGVTICLLTIGFVTLAYALVAFDALARRWFRWAQQQQGDQAMTRTLEEALDKFTLVTGTAGSETDMTACAASLLSWVDGGPFTDHPTCAHPIINSLVIRAFDADATTDDERVSIVKAGMTGMLNTWDIPTAVVVMAHSRTEPGDDPRSLAALCLDVLDAITWWKSDKQRPNLYRADLTGADLYRADLYRANLYGADLTGANLTRANLTRANLTRADLTGADLTRANLTGANLTGAYGVSLPTGWELSQFGIAQRTTEVSG